MAGIVVFISFRVVSQRVVRWPTHMLIAMELAWFDLRA